MMNFRNPRRNSYAAGYPATDAVTAGRLRANGDVFRRSGAVVLTNGTSTFIVDLAPFKKVSVEDCGGGIYGIVGRVSLEAESATKLATFGSEKGAKNGQAALLRAQAGVRTLSGGIGALKWAAGLAGLFCAAVVISAFLASVEHGAVAASAPAMPAPEAARHTRGNFDPSERTLEELAAGNYRFQPKLSAPEVELPALNCSKK